jgi:hypothetical protein
MSAAASASAMPWVRSDRGPNPAARARPEQPPGRVGEDLDVHAVSLVLSRVVRTVCGDAVDVQQGAVEDDMGLAHDDSHRAGQVRCQRGQKLDGFVDVAADGGQTDAESGGQAGAGVAAAQMGQDQQGLAAGGGLAPPAADPAPVRGQFPRQELEV